MKPEVARIAQELSHIADQLAIASSKLAVVANHSGLEFSPISVGVPVTDATQESKPRHNGIAKRGRLPKHGIRHSAAVLTQHMGPTVWLRPGGRFAVRQKPADWLHSMYVQCRADADGISYADVLRYFRREYSMKNTNTTHGFARELVHFAINAGPWAISSGSIGNPNMRLVPIY